MSIELLENSARQCLFVVVKGATKESITFPEGWRSQVISTPDALLSCVREGELQRRPVLVLINERQHAEFTAHIGDELGKPALNDLCFLVISKNPIDFLNAKVKSISMFDVVTSESLTKNLRFHLSRAVRELMRRTKRKSRRINQEMLEHLNHIFITLSAERDQKKLLTTILTEAIGLTGAEGGTLYMAEESDGEMLLQLKICQDAGGTPSIQAIHEKASENSISGYVILTGKPINIPIQEGLKPNLPLQFQRLPLANQNPTHKSILAVPLKNSENEIIAVLELVNKKGEKLPQADLHDSFDIEDESLISSFIAQAAICLENIQLYADIREVFDGFVKASVIAIEARDPSTGGHSERVANMTVELAKATSRTEAGIYRSVKFKTEEIRELEYAALLHDVGKIGVREEVLVKAKKLYPYQLEAIGNRVQVCREALRIRYLEAKLKTKSDLAEREYQKQLQQLEFYWSVIQSSNEPTILHQESVEALEKILQYQVKLSDGHMISLLNEVEFRALSVPLGSLTEEERLEVESHVRHTYQFLKMIPWTKSFKGLPDIAHAHHEKLDGSGYPRGLVSHEIPLQSKIMTIADIYDALVASDRWYKDAVPTEKALDILAQEVNIGQLDPVLFDIFLEAKVFETNHKKVKKTG